MAAIDLVYPGTNVAYDGISDHTRRLADALVARGHRVRVLGRGEDSYSGGVGYVNGWPDGNLRSTVALRAAIRAHQPALVVTQFEQFAYGTRGFNPAFGHFTHDLAKDVPETRRLLVVHETFPSGLSPRRLAMRTYQRRQLHGLVRSANSVVVTCEEWSRRLQHVGVVDAVCGAPNNLRGQAPARSVARDQLGLGEGLVVAVFGHLDAFRSDALRETLQRPEFDAATVVYVGKDSMAPAKLGAAAGVSVRTFLEIPDELALEVFAASDLALSPFADGATARRSSLNALLAAGLPTVTTVSRATDHLYRDLANVGALALAVPGGSFANTAAGLARSPAARVAMRNALAQRQDALPSWARLVDAVEAALPHPDAD